MMKVPPHYASEHSPGPWKWVPFKNWDGGLQAADGSYVISNDETDNTPENSHDAELIARAPEMLSLLRELEWAGSPAGECPICGGAPEREITEGAEPIPGTFLVRAGTGTKRTIPAWHTPDCRLSQLLEGLK